MVVFIILYADDFLLMGNDTWLLPSIKIRLSTQFQMKDLGKTQYVLGIKVLGDHNNRKLTLS